ncbi:DinB family protein [Melioribacteraceae bacterium 4301-Me]|uniref:DinB family protein n=1 Tax=Pyranulibacter aquaticus TaxID=3163344 RepID=UPI00359644EC
MHPKVKPLISIYEINSRLLINSFKDVSEELAINRPNKKINSMMFILLHTIDARYVMIKNLGSKTKNPFAEYVNWNNTIDDVKKYPPLKVVLDNWVKLDKVLKRKLSNLTYNQLKAKLDFDYPGNDEPIINMISFLAQHEAYHVGQLAMLRKLLGLSPLSF